MPYDPAINGIFDDEAVTGYYLYRTDPSTGDFVYFKIGGELDEQGNPPLWEPGGSCEPSPPLHPGLPNNSRIRRVAPGMPFAALVGRNNTPANPNFPGDKPFNGWHDDKTFPPASQSPANDYELRPLRLMPAQSRLDALFDENTPANQAIRTSPNFGGGNWFTTLDESLGGQYVLTGLPPAGADPADHPELWLTVDGSPIIVSLYARRGHPRRFFFYVIGPAS